MKRRTAIGLCAAVALGAVLLVASVQPAAAQSRIVYTNNFSQGTGGGTSQGRVSATWSSGATDVTPSGRYGRFLGQFGNDVVTLALTGLPPHRSVAITFKLFIIRTWDGNDTTFGPDFWEFGVFPGLTFLRTTFSYNPSISQSFPGQYPSNFAARSGALENNTLGYGDDSVYQIGRDFAHSGNSLTLYFAGSNLQPLFDESWGLDDVAVAISPP
jgi:hypothetical protein